MIIVLITAAVALAIAFVLGTALGFFRDFFAVPQDPLAANIREALPGANCGACGFPGCENYAIAIAAGNAGISSCSVGGPSLVEKLAQITGKTGEAVERTVAVLCCQGSNLNTPLKGIYTGIKNCRGAKLATGGTRLCSYGCIGFGDCVKACKFDALIMDGKKGLPVVDLAKCTGCGMCISECPQAIIKAVPKDRKGMIVLCSNRSLNRQQVAKNCKISCRKCGVCVKQCPQQCVDLGTNLPVADLSKCNSCGICVEKCPTKVLKIVEKQIIVGSGQ
jgi:Na+-translocating ferredoxin:NAD+ oxidoreductase RNF subunit RnfB